MSAGSALELRDIHLPAEPSWWPPAPGWWLLALLCLALLGWWALMLGRRYRQRRRRRALLAALSASATRHPPESAPAALLAELSELLRRAARRDAPDALALHGEAWLSFLDRGLADAPFSTGAGRALLDAPYRRDVDADTARAVLALVERRLRQFPPAPERG